jgi:RNA polymerase sigma-70 factor (ECF subfamily)
MLSMTELPASPPASTAQVWRDWHAALRRYVVRRVRNPADADDVLHEVFLKIEAHLSKLREPGRLAAWLYRIADNAIVDHYRGQRAWDELPDDLPAPETAADGTAALAACLRPMIEALPETYRQAVLWSEIDGLPQREVAERLGLSLSGAKSRVQRGRELLRAILLDCCHVDSDAEGLACAQKPGGPRYC